MVVFQILGLVASGINEMFSGSTEAPVEPSTVATAASVDVNLGALGDANLQGVVPNLLDNLPVTNILG